MMQRSCISAFVGVISLALSTVCFAGAAKDKVDFSSQIRPIISAKCFHCHGPDDSSRKAKLRLDVREEAVKKRHDNLFAIKPGDPSHSEMVRRITSKDPDDVMPPPKAGHPLTTAEIELLKKWVQEGAPYSGHWAFQRPQRPVLPKIKAKSWVKNSIDNFIAAKLESNGLKPSPVADRYSLVRRLSIDLTGLPPTPAEVNEFLNDKSTGAYEKLVDRLLASPAYGEKWARMWLDIARYADSAGYGSDPLRLNIWPYRDWVIKALNRNMPFDQFTTEQIAGDLLENATDEQRTASAFHRNTMTNTEGGTEDEEWRVAAVKDRANVTAQAWMGLTMGCAQCHSHKFDPITQKEYYQFYAFFNQTEDEDKPDERPTMPLPTPEERAKIEDLNKKIASVETKMNSVSSELAAEFSTWEKAHGASNAWSALEPLKMASAHGTTLTNLPDKSLLATGESPAKETYTVSFHSTQSDVSAVRLETLPDDSFPKKGCGRSPIGNFVLSEFRATFKPDSNEPPHARYLRIELPGPERILSLAEVQVFSGGTNVALGGKASQSSIDFEGPPKLAIDGNTNGHFTEAKSTTHTRSENDPWWEVDLGSERAVDSVVLWNRTDSEVSSRLSNFHVIAFDAGRKPIWATKIVEPPKPSRQLSLSAERSVVLKNATATFSEKKWEIADSIDDKADKKRGWSIEGQQAMPQTAVFQTLDRLPPGTLTFELVHNYGKQTTLGHFRISVGALPMPVLALDTNITAILQTPVEKRSPERQQEILKWFQQYAASTAKWQKEVAGFKQQLDMLKPVSVPVMRELPPDQRRVTHILTKGNYLLPAEEVTPGIPAAFHSWPANAPTNRLGVARWLTSPDNPLTARVMVNRIWAQIFGVGIVETEEDFGTQGTLPSHPELLDWMAVEFRDGGWDIKKLIKTIVMSSTYQQTSRVTPELLEKDPRNRLLSRSPRRRLDAEQVRDQALAVSGLLSRKIGGPSVYPPQPDGLWRAAFNGQRNYPTSKGEDRYRRGLYTIWRRTVPYPSMSTFDAPSRESCTFRRLPTNTPLQAFVTLNDPVYVECAQALGRRLVNEGGATVEERIRFGLRLVLARPEQTPQVAELKKLYDAELAHYGNAEKEAMKLATEPLGALPKNLSPAEAAAWTVIANVLLNLDGVLTKG